MILLLSATNAAGAAVHFRTESEQDAIATALRWSRDGCRDIQIADAARKYTLEEFATRVVNS